MTNCRKCGKQIDDNEIFCSKCNDEITKMTKNNRIIIYIVVGIWLVAMIGVTIYISMNINRKTTNVVENKQTSNEFTNEKKEKIKNQIIGRNNIFEQYETDYNYNRYTNDEIRDNYLPEDAVMQLGLDQFSLMEIYGVSYEYADYIVYWYSKVEDEYNIDSEFAK